MTASLAFSADYGISQLVEPLNEPPAVHVYRGHQTIFLLAQQISTSAAPRTSSCATTKDTL